MRVPSREEQLTTHWDNASDLARVVDGIAGADERAAGAFYRHCIQTAPPGAKPMIYRLLMDADSLRYARRTRH
ncbi:hypothetical protein UP09_18300 [Bradyrhizobium sp. LTSP885]|nr:hypothetical protein UP09_18300 [Bradyrhizobium sp. LTSP885]